MGFSLSSCDSPVKDTILVNDRWGKDCNCAHGDVKTCEDRYNPGKPFLHCGFYILYFPDN